LSAYKKQKKDWWMNVYVYHFREEVVM